MRTALRMTSSTTALLLCALLGWAASCGNSADGPGVRPGLRKEQTFWDEARSMPKVQGTTRYGKFVGEYSAFHPNGQVARRGTYSDEGLEEGVWNEWHQDGRAKSKVGYSAEIGRASCRERV